MSEGMSDGGEALMGIDVCGPKDGWDVEGVSGKNFVEYRCNVEWHNFVNNSEF